MRKGLTEVVFILDRSGSMSGLESFDGGGMLDAIKEDYSRRHRG